jgi:hypothetical protein
MFAALIVADWCLQTSADACSSNHKTTEQTMDDGQNQHLGCGTHAAKRNLLWCTERCKQGE